MALALQAECLSHQPTKALKGTKRTDFNQENHPLAVVANQKNPMPRLYHTCSEDHKYNG